MGSITISSALNDLMIRPRRNRKTFAIRALLEETTLTPKDLIAPLFLIEGNKLQEPITTMPGIHRISIDQLIQVAESIHASGILAIALFPSIEPSLKNESASYALNQNGLVPRAIQLLKKELPSLCVITDIALDPFTNHGHDGIIDETGEVLNDPTVEVLATMALIHAEAGADIVAPSDMMDGRIKAIRKHLDRHGYQNVSILSYAVKYASSLYAPFREAVGSELLSGHKKSYQLNVANTKEALREAKLDEEEGADLLMVKPALHSLDIITTLKKHSLLPIGGYHVSGEYAMVMAAHQAGILDADRVFLEALLCIKRSGADFIFSYAASRVLPLLSKRN